MERKRYQIIYTTVVCGEECQCLCTQKTASGSNCLAYNEEVAKRRVAELKEAGYKGVYYKELPWGTAWFDDENWIG